jgi:hypothetical protein
MFPEGSRKLAVAIKVGVEAAIAVVARHSELP